MGKAAASFRLRHRSDSRFLSCHRNDDDDVMTRRRRSVRTGEGEGAGSAGSVSSGRLLSNDVSLIVSCATAEQLYSISYLPFIWVSLALVEEKTMWCDSFQR